MTPRRGAAGPSGVLVAVLVLLVPLEGVVLDPAEAPLAGARVEIQSGALGYTTYTRIDGRFALAVPPGRYHLRVVTPKLRPLRLSVAAPAADLRVVMPVPLVRGFSVRIRQKAPTIQTTRLSRQQELDPLEICDLGISASRDRVYYLPQPLPPARISRRQAQAQVFDLLRTAGLWARD